MAARRAIVRKLPAIETIGAVDVMCVDKTGTLTKNRMTVKALWAGKRTFRAENSRLFENGAEAESGEVPGFTELAKTAVLCNDAFVDGGGKRGGDPMELALLEFASHVGMDKERLESLHRRMGEVPFDPQNKYMLTLNRHSNEVFYRLKGAPEKIAGMCDRIADVSGVKRITREDVLEIHRTTERFARKGLRVMAFAYKRKSHGSELDKGYVFSGLIALQDPLRPEAKDAVEKAKGAGIRLVMITGDHRITAETIAREAGILGKKDIVLTGEELEKMSDHELRKVCGRVAVYARTTSDHKLRIVKALKECGHRVAMTGDGVNDALALKEADVGVALGSGTEVAKEASDIVIADDNIASLVDAVEEGRHSSMNIRKVVKYLFSTNIAEVMFLMIILFSPFWLGSALPLALLPVHILYVNLVTDGFCDVTLATEKKDKTLMKEKPQKFAGGFFTRDVWKFIAITSVITVAGLFWAYSNYLGNDGNLAHARTMTFTLLSFFQLWSAINARTNEESVFSAGLFSNRYLSAAIVVSILTQLLVIYHPFFNEAMKTVPLGISDWALILGMSSSLFVIFEVLKFIERKGIRVLS
jgi:Ca2+-transporting ATPase